MSTKEKINQYLNTKGISPTKAEGMLNWGKGALTKSSSISTDKLEEFLLLFNDLSSEWLLRGKGEMIKSTGLPSQSPQIVEKVITKPRIPYKAAAGSITHAVEGITEAQCEQIPVINAFPNYDFTIIIKGDSMEPKYEGGDEVACKRVDGTSFIQWGKVHVLDTAQGIVIKRIYEDGDKNKCVSYNPDYPPFSIDKSEIYSINLVVGLLRI